MYGWQERIVKLFENNTYSVVNIFDVTLRPQLNVTGVVEVIVNETITNVSIYMLSRGGELGGCGSNWVIFVLVGWVDLKYFLS